MVQLTEFIDLCKEGLVRAFGVYMFGIIESSLFLFAYAHSCSPVREFFKVLSNK